MRISDWSSDVCSSDLGRQPRADRGDLLQARQQRPHLAALGGAALRPCARDVPARPLRQGHLPQLRHAGSVRRQLRALRRDVLADRAQRSEEHTSELQSLMRISYAVFCLKKKTNKHPRAERIKVKQEETNQI